MEHLDDPVEEYILLIRTAQTFTISSLPRGKYIVCGEALGKMGDVYQESCMETRIRKRESKKTGWILFFFTTYILSRTSLQSRVQALISVVMVLAAIVYAILVQVCTKVCGSPQAKN